MAKEFGSTDYNNDAPYTNDTQERDNRPQRGNPLPGELHDYSRQKEQAPKGKAAQGRSLLRTLSAASAAAVAAVVLLPAVSASAPDVRFDYLNATDSVLEYIVSFENFEADADIDILIVTPNGNTVSVQPAEEEIVSGTVTGLNAGARYEIVVKSGNATVASRGVVMAKKRITALRSIESQCHCAVDGTFHFRLDLIDENEYWSGFFATLEDEFGTRSECDFSAEPTKEQQLAVNDVGMRGNRAVLRITCITVEPDESGDCTPREFVLYEGEVSI